MASLKLRANLLWHRRSDRLSLPQGKTKRLRRNSRPLSLSCKCDKKSKQFWVSNKSINSELPCLQAKCSSNSKIKKLSLKLRKPAKVTNHTACLRSLTREGKIPRIVYHPPVATTLRTLSCPRCSRAKLCPKHWPELHQVLKRTSVTLPSVPKQISDKPLRARWSNRSCWWHNSRKSLRKVRIRSRWCWRRVNRSCLEIGVLAATKK